MKSAAPALLLASLSWLLPATAADYVEGEVIVTFKQGGGVEASKRSLRKHSLAFARRFPRISAAKKRQIGVVRDRGKTTAELIAALREDPDVEAVEPNYLRALCGAPDDPFFGVQWGLENTGQMVNFVFGTPGADIKFLAARGLANPAAPPVVVGVADTGIHSEHPDLAPSLWTHPGEIPANGIDDDGNGRIDDVHGFNFVTGTDHITDAGTHGTHVSGIISAAGNNATGIAGTYGGARLMTFKISHNGNNTSVIAFIEALEYAVEMKAAGVNLAAVNASFGSGTFVSAEQSAIQAAGDAGIIVCAAAGNESRSNDAFPIYPANYRLPNMIVVAASNSNDGLWPTSNHSATKVDLAAPGSSVYSATSSLSASFQAGATIYAANAMQFSGASPTPVAGSIHDCGLGLPGDFPPGVNGNIALIQRGSIVQSEKVQNAMAAGAKAVIVYNNTSGVFLGTLDADLDWIPVATILQADGLTIKALLPQTGTVTVNRDPGYAFESGTSMATPHVSAAVALAAAHFPEDSVAERIQRVLDNVDLKPAFSGKTVTGGRLNLQRILDSDGNTLPDWWEKEHFNQYTGGDPDADPDGDGRSNRDEFLASTLPLDASSVLRTVSAIRAAGTGHFTLQWQSVPGKTYRIVYNDDLSGTWLTDLPGSLITVPPGEVLSTFTDTTAASPAKRFYRVEAVNP